jgi:hypothetical protein
MSEFESYGAGQAQPEAGSPAALEEAELAAELGYGSPAGDGERGGMAAGYESPLAQEELALYESGLATESELPNEAPAIATEAGGANPFLAESTGTGGAVGAINPQELKEYLQEEKLESQEASEINQESMQSFGQSMNQAEEFDQILNDD